MAINYASKYSQLVDFSDEDRQALLEAPGLLARSRKLLEILVREQQMAELKNEIQEKVKREIDKQQRDYYLQQQLRTIQDELGDTADAEIEQMREAAKKKNWPKDMGELFEKELAKVERLNPAVAEYSVQMQCGRYNYLFPTHVRCVSCPSLKHSWYGTHNATDS